MQKIAQNLFYHGSDSDQIDGPLRINERDSGWFGSGFYVTAYPEYAKRWGKYVYRVSVPSGKFVEVLVHGNYDRVEFLGDAESANQLAGGTNGWIENESKWSLDFTNTVKYMGYSGIRVHMNGRRDVEVVVFDPSTIQILGKAAFNWLSRLIK